MRRTQDCACMAMVNFSFHLGLATIISIEILYYKVKKLAVKYFAATCIIDQSISCQIKTSGFYRIVCTISLDL